MSEFAVVIFHDERKAYEGLHALQELHAEGSLTVYGTTVVQRDASGKLSIVQDLAFDAPKTKTAAEVLDTLELDGKLMLVLPSPSDFGAVEKYFRNIRGVRVAYARSLGVYEVIAADHLVITESALDVVEGSRTEPEGAPSEAPADDAQAGPTTEADAGGEAE